MKHLTWSVEGDDKWKVTVYFFPPRPRQLTLSDGHSQLACVFVFLLTLLCFVFPSSVGNCFFSVILVFFLTTLLESFICLFSSRFCVHFFLFFSSFIFHFILFLPHRSGCSCGTQQGKSGSAASSQVILEILLPLLSCTTSQVSDLTSSDRWDFFAALHWNWDELLSLCQTLTLSSKPQNGLMTLEQREEVMSSSCWWETRRTLLTKGNFLHLLSSQLITHFCCWPCFSLFLRINMQMFRMLHCISLCSDAVLSSCASF